MLKFQVRSKASSPSTSSTSSSCTTSSSSFTASRCNSISSLSSVDSSEALDFGILKVFTENVRAFTDYKTIRVSSTTTAQEMKLSAKDSNLFRLWMEVRTRGEKGTVTSELCLPADARPLSLYACHPAEMSRFVMRMREEATLVRLHDGAVCPQSNYKSVLVAPETSAEEALRLLYGETGGDLSLFLSDGTRQVAVPGDSSLAAIARSLLPPHRILVQRVL